ncbi:urea carboxylase [Saccharospirillum sp. MSK14-1]|uniref:urea carboxylase n=1 Tax=Saccharospirillum sp. MSK14-1 TaxID=1897632 RepID=UPI000D3679E3|nr:urea carboxylase [Saccharospirillum sp. MSK14-1]PTY37644.1 urea carboxylase [Saccharospirillum sp. MSK14-1]
MVTTALFQKVLIANRGAIAVRIARSLRQLGIPAVAVYADSDADSLHVRQASEACSLGEGGASDTYLNVDKLLDIARQSGADAIHPGYGFLSENADFVRQVEAAGLAFIGPTPEQIETFGLKHSARELAQRANVPLVPGSELLADLPDAQREAERIGFPVMLKATSGGGGIGMQRCNTAADLDEAFERVKRLGRQNFADDGVFLEKFIERARHIEVQVFGDGAGKTLAIGERDCSSQRRNQKVVEECPAPNLSATVAGALHKTAERLLAAVHYRNAGTVEFIVDADSNDFYFLEVNTRLQVEHGVTEAVFGIDLVEWMLRQAAGDSPLTPMPTLQARGHALQVRLYAEDPYRDFQPAAGLLTEVAFAQGDGIRVDTWIEAGLEVPPYFDPMLAKLIVHGADRGAALTALQQALGRTRLYGIETNLDYLRALVTDTALQNGTMTTRYLNDFRPQPARIDVLSGGTQTTIQDASGRLGYWDVGVPPSGAFDRHSFALGNRLLDNPGDAAGLEITVAGPTLRFSVATQIVLTGAEIDAELEGAPVPLWQVVEVAAGQTLTLGKIGGRGARAYLCVRGGLDCPPYLGSRATFTLGQFGGHNGRALRSGDVLHVQPSEPVVSAALDEALQPTIEREWQLRVVYGPHGAPDFFTPHDIDTFFATDWEVHYNSSRTGIRLIGPKPDWARADGGEAGLHPSNIHDNAYAFGSVDFTGDMPVILGPDGPSLGGFVCPVTVISADLWQLGQLRAGDRIRFVPVSIDTAVALEAEQLRAETELAAPSLDWSAVPVESPIVHRLPASEAADAVVYRAAGDHFLLVEYGDPVLDIRLRFRAHALMQWLQQYPLPGMRELTPGIRSLQVHYDSQRLSLASLLQHLEAAEFELSQRLDELSVPSRIVHLPLSWDDDACRLAIEKYQQSVRRDAPWCPSNLEFIRRINGLDDIDAVKTILFDAAYLVMGLGDVYLGAPVATPIDPRHRLVTTKYNPARTWTAENSVGIGGSYLCVYGMEGPGGYQFVGRTLQMWNRYRQTAEFEQPWLLRFFDQIRFYEVSHDELQQIRRDFPLGRYPLKIEQTTFNLADYQAFIDANQSDIDAYSASRQAAFEAELADWHAKGQFNYQPPEPEKAPQADSWPEGSAVVDSPVTGSVWQFEVSVDAEVKTGDTLVILESMKMEIPLYAPCDGRVIRLLSKAGARVDAGQPIVVVQPSNPSTRAEEIKA